MSRKRSSHKRSTYTMLRAAAHMVHKKMGSGHREAVYQRAFVTELASRGVPSQAEVPPPSVAPVGPQQALASPLTLHTQVPVPFFLRGICVGHGRVDVLTNQHVVELKSVRATDSALQSCRNQLNRYLTAMRASGASRRHGVVIFFDPVVGGLHIEQLSK